MAVERKRVSPDEGLTLLGLSDKGQITVASSVKKTRLRDFWRADGRVMTRQGQVISATVTTDGKKPPVVTFWLR
jgi:hypothetical protein